MQKGKLANKPIGKVLINLLQHGKLHAPTTELQEDMIKNLSYSNLEVMYTSLASFLNSISLWNNLPCEAIHPHTIDIFLCVNYLMLIFNHLIINCIALYTIMITINNNNNNEVRCLHNNISMILSVHSLLLWHVAS